MYLAGERSASLGRNCTRFLLLIAGLALLTYWWAPWEEGRTRVDRAKRKELFKTLGRLHDTSAEIEENVKAKRWTKAAKAGNDMFRHINDAVYFGIGDVFPDDDHHKAAREFEQVRVSYVSMVSAIERGDFTEAERLEAKARRHYHEAFAWAADY